MLLLFICILKRYILFSKKNEIIYFLAGQSVEALFYFGERAFAQLSSQQIVADTLIVRKSGDYLLCRDEKIRRYDYVFGVFQAIFAGVVYVIV